MPPAGRLRSLARTGLLCLAVLAAVFGPAALDGGGRPDPSALTAAVLAPTAGPSVAWRDAPAPRDDHEVAAAPLAVLVAAVLLLAPAARATRGARRRCAPPVVTWGRPPPGRAPPLLVVV